MWTLIFVGVCRFCLPNILPCGFFSPNENLGHTQCLLRKPQRRRRHADRLPFMRGYFNGDRRGSTSSEQSEPQDGSDSSGRRVRRRVNCIFSTSSNSDSVFQSDDSESTAYDAGELS